MKKCHTEIMKEIKRLEEEKQLPTLMHTACVDIFATQIRYIRFANSIYFVNEIRYIFALQK